MTSESDGVLSLPLAGTLTYREAHAFQEGLHDGAAGVTRHEYGGQERHYWKMGWLVGAIVLYRVLPEERQP